MNDREKELRSVIQQEINSYNTIGLKPSSGEEYLEMLHYVTDKIMDHIEATHPTEEQKSRRAEEQKWISVEGQLPEYREPVLVCWMSKHDGEKQSVATLYEITRYAGAGSPKDNKWYLSYARSTPLDVTHWMPLPKHPKT